ncbi:MAG: Uma2 family endonuclease [Acidobacteriota bacterium]|nr:Uma2 family endonuclease [Acidobacteriota bacterium]
MAAAHSFLTPDRFEQLYTDDCKPYFEYWFGEAIQKSTRTAVHGVLQWVLAMLLARRGWKAATEVRLKISQVAHPVPDVIASSAPLQDPYPTEPFDLCVEILSPGDNLHDMFIKAAHYLDWGIRSVWIIDPKEPGAYSMSLENPQPVPVGMSGCLVAGSGGTEAVIPLSELFAETGKHLGKKVEDAEARE